MKLSIQLFLIFLFLRLRFCLLTFSIQSLNATPPSFSVRLLLRHQNLPRNHTLEHAGWPLPGTAIHSFPRAARRRRNHHHWPHVRLLAWLERRVRLPPGKIYKLFDLCKHATLGVYVGDSGATISRVQGTCFRRIIDVQPRLVVKQFVPKCVVPRGQTLRIVEQKG